MVFWTTPSKPLVFCECDMANLPYEDHTAEIVVLSMAMWGSNCRDYLREAHRVLETSGRLFIIEPTKRWTTDEQDPGHLLASALVESGFHIMYNEIDRFCLFVCTK